MPGYIFPGAFSPGSFHTGGLPTPSDPTSVAKSFKKNSPGCGCCCKCCDQCEGDSPCRWRVNIGGRMYNLKHRGSTDLTNGAIAGNNCYWTASFDSVTSGDCTFDNLLLVVGGPVPWSDTYRWTLLAGDGATAVGRWYKETSGDAPSCVEPHTLVNTPGNLSDDCLPIGNAVIEPEKIKICDPCCPECSGATPERWTITIGAETFVLSDREYGGAHCYWATTFAARVFGTSPGAGICEDYTGIKLETNNLLLQVTLTGGTTDVNWSVGFPGTPNCTTESTLTLQTSNTCTLPTTITATPGGPVHQCGSSECGACIANMSQWSVEIVGSPLCSGDLDGTYILDPISADGCWYGYDLSIPGCDYVSIEVLVTYGAYYLTIRKAELYDFALVILWQETEPYPRDCNVTRTAEDQRTPGTSYTITGIP